MDCRFPDLPPMKEVKKHIKKSCALLRSLDAIDFNAHTFNIYLHDSFRDDVAVSLNVVQKKIKRDLARAVSGDKKNLLSFIPSSLPHLVEICNNLSKKGLVLFLENKSSPGDSFIVCDRATLLSNITGTVFAPEGFRQHCSLASSTGVVPLSKFSEAFKGYDIEMLIAFMSHLEFCFEIKDEEVLGYIRKAEPDSNPDSRFLFFPGLIRIHTPEQVWEEDSTMRYHFGWELQTSQDTEFFDHRCLQVLILRLVFAFGLAPASRVQDDLPSIQRFCSVWKSGICWCNDDGIISHLELSDNGKSFVLKMRSEAFKLSCLAHRAKIINKVLESVNDFCPNVVSVESLIDPQQVVERSLKASSSLTLFNISDLASAITSGKDVMKSLHRALSIKHVLHLEPLAGLDCNTLQCVYSEKSIMRDEKVSNAFISHFASQVTDPESIAMYKRILSPVQAVSGQVVQTGNPMQEVTHTLEAWRSKTGGTYRCLRETFGNYSIFAGRNPLDLAGVPHSEFDPSIFPESGKDQLSLETVMEATNEVRSEWYSLAVQLHVSHSVRKSIRTTYHDDADDCFHLMMKHWVRQTSPPPSWAGLVRALEAPVIGRGDIARHIKDVLGEVDCDDGSEVPDELVGPQDILVVDRHLKSVRERTWEVRAKWYDMGVELGLNVGTLQVIRHNHHDVAGRCYTDLLECWLTETSPSPTWAALVEAIRSPAIDCGYIADQIEVNMTRNC